MLSDRFQRLLLSEHHRLPLWLPVGLASGVLLWFQPRYEPSPWFALAGLVLSCPVLIAGWWRLSARLAGCALLCVSLGFLAAWSEGHRAAPMPELPRHAVILTGRVLSVDQLPSRVEGEPGSRRVTLAGVRFETWLDAGMAPLRRSLRVRLRTDDSLIFGPGDRLQVRALLSAPAFPVMPGARDMQREAWFGGLAGTGRALGPAVFAAADGGGPVTAEPDGAGDEAAARPGRSAPHRTSLEWLRERIAARIMAVLPGTDGAIGATLLVGQSSAIPASDRDAFAASGLSHLLAVAGLHLGIVVGLVVAATRYGLVSVEWVALRWPCKEIAALAGLLGGTVYVVMTGLHLPALRSLAMAALVVLALVTGRRAASMRGLAVAAALLLLTGPSVLLDVPFQMSFAAVMALIAGYEVLRRPLMRLHGDGGLARRFMVHVATLALTSLLAGLATLPVSMAHFGEIQPFFVVANLVAVPLTALWVMPAGLAGVMLIPFHLDMLAFVPMGWGIHAIVWSAREVASWPAARIAVPMTPGVGLATFLLGLCWLCLWSRRWRLLGIVPMLAGFISPFVVSLPDLVVAPDGGVVAIRDGAALLVAGRSRDAWFEREGLAQAFARPVSDLPVAGGETADGDLSCGEDGTAGVCVLARAGRSVLVRAEDRSDGEDLLPEKLCLGMDLFVTVSPARRSCTGVRTVDRFTVWREGAQAVWLKAGGIRVVSDRAWSGERLWVMRPGGHGVPNLPMAEAE
ncbi:ComEC/Rec2 family competence protein [Acetobacter oeni]|uniref:ComEC/Rec2 family competence protein n=5 Tax=Acetobacter oeni TaxID=304077 RepID=UPI0015681C19|nr:ComEC/Rec2 family competence protein [Acetobacter oeni]MBB3884082.1 competence protein ComEC [Acetobacter oeni]